VLYHGSFKALAQDTEKFNWVEEAWETLTHEIRHHVEWKARADKLEAFDEAAESNFARMDREAFDPSFYKDGMRRQDGGWQVDDDVFFERVVRIPPAEVSLVWHGEDYVIRIPEDTGLPAFLTLTGLREPPPGDVVLVLQKHGSWLEVFRKPRVYQAEVAARRLVQ
jgi:hypothetical protein